MLERLLDSGVGKKGRALKKAQKFALKEEMKKGLACARVLVLQQPSKDPVKCEVKIIYGSKGPGQKKS